MGPPAFFGMETGGRLWGSLFPWYTKLGALFVRLRVREISSPEFESAHLVLHSMNGVRGRGVRPELGEGRSEEVEQTGTRNIIKLMG